MRFFISILIITYSIDLFSQLILPAYKDKKWWIINDDRKIPLRNTITYVDFYDENGHAMFSEFSKYGIIDGNGKELIPPIYTEIISFGYGLYHLIDKNKSALYDFGSQKTVLDSVRNTEWLNDDYLLIFRDSSKILFHPNSKKSWIFQDSFDGFDVRYKFISAQVDTNEFTYFLSDGSLFKSGDDVQIEYLDNSILIEFKDSTLIIGEFYTNVFKRYHEKIRADNYYLSYYDGALSHLIDLQTGDKVISLPYEGVEKARFGGYRVFKGNKQGYVDVNLNLRIPIEYDWISKELEYYTVSKNGLNGLYDSLFKIVLPPIYDFFYFEKDWIRCTVMDGEMSGLYSKKQNKLIFKPLYKKYIVKGNLIKAYSSDKIHIVELDENHAIISELFLPNAITAAQIIPDENFKYDKRLLSLGWYFETTSLRDSNNEITSYRHLWGLKNENDSIIVQPKFSTPVYLPEMPLSLLRQGVTEYVHWTGKVLKERPYIFFNIEKGKPLTMDKIVDVDTSDVYLRSFVRYETTTGYKLYYSNQLQKEVNYISCGNGKFLPYCVGAEKHEFTIKEKDVVRVNHIALNGNYNQSLNRIGILNNVDLTSVRFIGAKWNFLDTNGEDLFKEDSFDFVQEFFRNTAIVKKQAWGVVSTDSMIIPPIFSDVSRVKLFDDTLFLVRKDRSRSEFLNNEAELFPQKFSTLFKKKGNLAIFMHEDQNIVTFKGKEIFNCKQNINLLNEDHFVSKLKKEYQVHDSTGNVRWSSLKKPKMIVLNNFILLEENGRKFLVDETNDTLYSGSANAEFEEINGNLLIKDEIQQCLINSAGKIIVKVTNDKTIIPDRYAENYAISSKLKIVIYNYAGDIIGKINIGEESYKLFLVNGIILSETSVITGTKTLKGKIELEDSKLLKDGYIVRFEKDSVYIYHESIDVPIAVEFCQKLNYLGKGYFVFIGKSGKKITNFFNSIELNPRDEVAGNFDNNYLLIRSKTEKYFIDTTLNKAFNRTFLQAEPFYDSVAIIKTNFGWTLINSLGENLSFPSFSKIEYCTDNVYQVRKDPLFGLYDSHGNELLKPVYERIYFVNKEVIQVMKDGEIGYVHINGKEIFNIIE